MAIEKELVRTHKFHPRHIHFHPHHPPLNNSTSSGGILTALGASLVAHPMGWAIGVALFVVGIIGVIAYNVVRKE